MKVLNLQQGSPEWLATRAKHFTASEAPAMLGLSRYTTRAELLRQKATGVAKEIDDSTQRRFDAGHAAEESARPLADAMVGDTLYPITGTAEIDGLPLLASFDGLTLTEDTAWENKLWNTEFAAHVLNTNDAPDTHWPQLEQQLLVSGAKRVLFTVCDGTKENLVKLWYESKPERRAQLIAGWKQFAEDLQNYQHAEIIPAAVAAPQMQLPAVSVQVLGSIEVRDNLAVFGDALRAYVERINRQPETDQDFADLEATVKTLKTAEEALDAAENGALAQAASIDQMRRIVAESRELARTTRLTIEKLVKAEKENRRLAILQGAQTALAQHVAALNLKLGKSYMPTIAADFAGVMRSKKTIASLQNAVDTELARCKIEADRLAADIAANLASLRKLAADHAFLFADTAQIVLKQNDDLVLLIKSRIADHQAAEEKRLAVEREKIRAEEAAKLERQQAEQKRIAALWVSSMLAAVAEDQRKAEIASAENIKQDANSVEQVATTILPGQVLHAAPAAVDNAIVSAWQKPRDAVVALVDQMSLTELALAKTALENILAARQPRAA